MAPRFEDPGFLPAPNHVTHDPSAPNGGDDHDYRYLKDACNSWGVEDTSELGDIRKGEPGINRYKMITDTRTIEAEILADESSGNMHNMTPEEALIEMGY